MEIKCTIEISDEAMRIFGNQRIAELEAWMDEWIGKCDEFCEQCTACNAYKKLTELKEALDVNNDVPGPP